MPALNTLNTRARPRARTHSANTATRHTAPAPRLQPTPARAMGQHTGVSMVNSGAPHPRSARSCHSDAPRATPTPYTHIVRWRGCGMGMCGCVVWRSVAGCAGCEATLHQTSTCTSVPADSPSGAHTQQHTTPTHPLPAYADKIVTWNADGTAFYIFGTWPSMRAAGACRCSPRWHDTQTTAATTTHAHAHVQTCRRWWTRCCRATSRRQCTPASCASCSSTTLRGRRRRRRRALRR